MPLFDWNQNYLINNSKIDNQHKKLVDILNRLYDAMKVGKGNDILSGVIKELIDYTKVHFSEEEKLMIESKYPSYSSHFKEHSAFITKVEAVYKDFNSGKVGLSLELMQFLKDWLSNHILGVDKKFGEFVTQKKID